MDFKAQFEQRIILLRNGACCAVLKQPDSSKLFVVLSSSGAFVQIYFGGNQFKHLTRFVPVRFEEAVQKVLMFRNSFAFQPFLCKRFQSKGNLCDSLPAISKCIGVPSNETSKLKLFICPLLRRISIIDEHCINADDNCIEYPIRGVELANSYITENKRVFSLSRLPATLKSAILDSANNNARTNIGPYVARSVAVSGSAARTAVATDSMAETTKLLDALMIHMSVLASDRDKYPIGVQALKKDQMNAFGELDTMVMAECLDEDIYLVSSVPTEFSPGQEQLRRTQLRKLLRRLKSSANKLNEEQSQEDTQNNDGSEVEVHTGELEVEVWIRPSEEHPAGVIIHLRGDYFTFHCESSPGELFEKSFHNSFLQYELHRRAQVLELGHEDLTTCEDIDEDSTAPGEFSFNVSMLLRRYYKEALKLIRYRDYLLEQAQRCGEAAFNNALSVPDTSVGSRVAAANDHVQPFRAVPAEVTSSCSTVSLSTEDGSNFSAVLRHCSSAAEAAPYNLILSQVPSSSHATVPPVNTPPKCRVYPCECVTQICATFADHTMLKFDLSSQMFTVLFATGRECSFSLGSYKREEGIFACRAYIPQIDDSFHGRSNPRSIPVHGINVPYPAADEVNVPHICHLVRRVLAFHRWADTPAALRPALEEHDRRTAVVARAAAQQASRHLLMTRVAEGTLTAQEALGRSSLFDSRLQSLTSPTSPTLAPPLAQNRAQQHRVSGARETANNRSERSEQEREVSMISSPSPFACITPSPVGRRVALVSDGSTIATGVSTSERSSSLTYSQLSSIPTVSSASAPDPVDRYSNTGRRVAIVSPESAKSDKSERDYVAHTADKVAGAYLYNNIVIHPTLNSFGKPETPPYQQTHVVSPETSQFQEIMSANKKACEKVQFIDVPQSRRAFPDYQPALNSTTSRYLSATYVQSAVEDSMRQANKNAEYLRQFNIVE